LMLQSNQNEFIITNHHQFDGFIPASSPKSSSQILARNWYYTIRHVSCRQKSRHFRQRINSLCWLHRSSPEFVD
jgi:hypothetical protein